mgnify:CR=1 FL=1
MALFLQLGNYFWLHRSRIYITSYYKKPRKKLRGVCNLTLGKTYFVVLAFTFWPLWCLCFGFTMPVLFWGTVAVVVFVLLADDVTDVLLVFGAAVFVVVVDCVVFVFCVVWAETITANPQMSKRLIDNFFMTFLFLEYKVMTCAIIFRVVNSQLTVIR